MSIWIFVYWLLYRSVINGLPTKMFKQKVFIPSLVFGLQHLAHIALHGLRDVIHVLRLDDRLQVVLQDARKVVLNITEYY